MFLYHIIDKIHSTSNYLLGSLHIFPFESLHAKVKPLLLECDLLVTEHMRTDLKEVLAGEINTSYEGEEVTSFLDLLPEEMQKEIKIDIASAEEVTLQMSRFALENVGVPLAALTPRAIGLIAQILFYYAPGIDAVIADIYEANSKKIEYLEDPIHKIGFIEKVEDSINFTTETLTQTLNECFHSSSRREVEEYVVESYNHIPEIEADDDVTYRNTNWMLGSEPYKSLPQLLEQDNILIVVGCGHLFGTKGILKKLGDEGYEIYRMDSDLVESLCTVEDLLGVTTHLEGDLGI